MKKLFFICLVLILAVAGVFFIFRESQAPNIQFLPLTPSQEKTSPANQSTSLPANIIVVRMMREGFSPHEIKIKKGDKVSFKNVDTQYHWPASDVHPTHDRYPEFDPKKPVAPNTSWEFVFEKQGAWQFHDHLNPGNRGVITVE